MSNLSLWYSEEPLPSSGVECRPDESLLDFARGRRYATILADPPWRFANRTGKMAPEHRRLSRYETMGFDEIAELPVPDLLLPESHLYLWVPNALLEEGLRVMRAWGFTYKTNLVWYKIRADGGPDGRGVGFYFRNVTEMVLFGVHGTCRTLQPGRRQVNLFQSRKRGHSRKPDELYQIVEQCSPGPYLELFARYGRRGWDQWGNEAPDAGEEGIELEEQVEQPFKSQRVVQDGAMRSVENRQAGLFVKV